MTTTIKTRSHTRARLRGLAATLTLVALVAGVPIVLVAIRAVPDLAAFSWSRLTQPDDGTLVLEVLTCVGWAAWAIFTCQLLVAIASQIRGIRAPRLPGLVVPQLAADRLVAAAALLFVAVPAATALLPQPRADAAVTPAAAAAPALPETTAGPSATSTALAASQTVGPSPGSERALDEKPFPPVEPYMVKRGDSLWRIAEDRLGDGARYVELVELNQAVLDGRPDFLLPGTTLQVPVLEIDDHAGATSAGPNTASPQVYVVQPGDTLSQIAQDTLGDADAYPAIFQASRDNLQSDGHRLTDPDLILPGWKLTLPSHHPIHPDATTKSSDHRRPDPPTDDPEHPPAPASPPSAPTHLAPAEPPDDAATDNQRSTDHAEANRGPEADPDTGSATPGWLLPGLAGAGSVLGGALWLVLRAQRRTQLRHRRPGTIIPAPSPDLIPVEKTARATASVIAPRITALDTALRVLPQHLRLLAATLDDDAISLTLRTPADLPEPWSGAATRWRIRLADVPKRPADLFPPYPLLVSVGRATDEAFVFLNLEELRTVAVTGDPHRTQAFARHLASELALNPWSSVTTVDLLGLGAALASFNLGRIRTHPAGDIDFITDLARGLSSITEPSDPDDFYAAIVATTDSRVAELSQLTEVIESIPGRSSAVLIELDGVPRPTGAHLDVTADGRLHEASLGLDLAVAGLTEEEARACALLLDLTLDDTMTPVPVSDRAPAPTSVDAVEAVCDLAGALVDELTQARGDGAADEASLLPLDAQAYADAAATTVDDVEMLAPRAVPQARAAVAAADPGLDDDLARWDSPSLVSTKLILLGPVGARTTGDAKATAHRRPFYIELLAYLALHPRGATSADVAEAFGLRPDRVRVDMSQLRRWLGSDPRTGEPYLPKAESSHGADAAAVYKVRGVLSDLDLFRRLRARGQSRGAEGIDDLIAALRLVSGEPFTQLRKDHWNWLLDGERWDHVMSAAIVDVAHIVTTHALAGGNLDLALWAAQVAYSASPYDEVAQLDIIAAAKARGDDGRADRDLGEKVFNRRDDDMPPIDIPARSAEIVENKSWAVRGPRSRRTG